jgi:hypothetical protein
MSEYRYRLCHKILVASVNIFVLASLFFAMYKASLDPDNFNAVFFKTIFSLLLVTLLSGYLAKRYMLKLYRNSLPHE